MDSFYRAILGVFIYWVLLIAAILQKSSQYFDDVINFILGRVYLFKQVLR